jgi:mannitol-1-phosphate/altronate dehydrogenase
VVSCDNLRSNGATTRIAVVSHAAALDPGLAAWIDEHVAFPNSMVDCIVPASTPALREQVRATWAVDDPQTVLCETYRQWVIERPPGRLADLTEVGVQAVEDVAPYEAAKARIINGSHVMLGHLGLLLGHRFVHEAVADEDLAALVRSFMRNDVFPYLQMPAGLDAQEYHEAAMARFANQPLADQLRRLAFDGAAKLPTYVANIAQPVLRAGASEERLALMVAAHRAFTRWAVTSGGLSRGDLEPSIGDRDWQRLVSGSPDALAGCEYLSSFGAGSHRTFWRSVEAACAAMEVDVRAAVVAAR